MLKNILVLCLLIITIKPASAQDEVRTHTYPQGYFRYPIDLPPSTAGSFGELRPNHFHSGLDFRTNQRTGYPVHAAAEGYISRLKIQYGGFGNALYISHPNGFTTVYGHLDHFTPEILAYIHQQQIAQQKWDVDLNLMPFQMPVTKDQVVAWSGNTGASGGPHLHFEIRDTKSQETINAQLFGLTIPDRVAPFISGVSVYHMNERPFSEDILRQSYAVHGTGGDYHLLKPQTLELSGQIGFGISAIDMNSASPSRNGVYSIQLNVDGKTVFTFAVERFAFDQTHAINAYIDYPAQQRGAGFIQKCFVLPGSRITLYPQSVNRGLVNFTDNELHDVEFVVRDVAGNTSRLALKVKSNVMKDRPVFNPTGTLLRCNEQSEFNRDNIKVIIPPGNLYDDVDFQYSASPRRPGAYSELHHLHNRLTPIHDTIEVWIKSTAPLTHPDKALVYSIINGATDSEYSDGWVKGRVTGFGDYEIKEDTIAPVITPLNIHNGSNLAAARSINFRLSDNLSGVKTYVAKIDGKWVPLVHDFKSKLFIYTFDGGIAAGKHSFELGVTDYKNNSSTFTAQFYR